MEKLTQEDYRVIKENLGLDELDVNIVQKLEKEGNEKGFTRYISMVMLYNTVSESYKNIFKFIFITLPIFITYPIWKLIFDVYRSVMERRLNVTKSE